ncbi:hypothetical protein B0H13DRAFT_1892281 [Mycena leptocephala]|nr:hypothetical protein B0H13DRAFT_1892281 [Mycena leptocephala]
MWLVVPTATCGATYKVVARGFTEARNDRTAILGGLLGRQCKRGERDEEDLRRGSGPRVTTKMNVRERRIRTVRTYMYCRPVGKNGRSATGMEVGQAMSNDFASMGPV